MDDLKYMKLALQEALVASERGEVPIGAVVVDKFGTVIARGHNLVETLGDPTAHAEMQAITSATAYLGGKYLNECTLYVTLEPCTMCAGALRWAQIGRIVWGADDAKGGFSMVSPSILHPKTLTTNGVMGDECGEIVSDFFKKKRIKF